MRLGKTLIVFYVSICICVYIYIYIYTGKVWKKEKCNIDYEIKSQSLDYLLVKQQLVKSEEPL